MIIARSPPCIRSPRLRLRLANPFAGWNLSQCGRREADKSRRAGLILEAPGRAWDDPVGSAPPYFFASFFRFT